MSYLFVAVQCGKNDAPLPPERGSSYAIMSQQNALRSNNQNVSNVISVPAQQQLTSVKRVSFHDSNVNIDSVQQQNIPSGNLPANQTIAMDIIAEDPNVSISCDEEAASEIHRPEVIYLFGFYAKRYFRISSTMQKFYWHLQRRPRDQLGSRLPVARPV